MGDKGVPHPFRAKPAPTPPSYRGGTSSLATRRTNLLNRRATLASPKAKRTAQSRRKASGPKFRGGFK